MSGMHCVHSDTAADGKHFSTSKYQQGWPIWAQTHTYSCGTPMQTNMFVEAGGPGG